MPRLAAHVNQSIEAGQISRQAKIFMIAEPKGWLLKCGYLPDASWDMYSWRVTLMRNELDYRRIDREFAAAGIDFMIVNNRLLRWCIGQGVSRDAVRFGTYHLLRYLQRRGEIIGVDDDELFIHLVH